MNAPQATPVHLEEEIQWRALLAAGPGTPDGHTSPLHALYGPLRDARRQASFAIGHLAQSLDGSPAST